LEENVFAADKTRKLSPEAEVRFQASFILHGKPRGIGDTTDGIVLLCLKIYDIIITFTFSANIQKTMRRVRYEE